MSGFLLVIGLLLDLISGPVAEHRVQIVITQFKLLFIYLLFYIYLKCSYQRQLLHEQSNF